jgi:hypothetical protein
VQQVGVTPIPFPRVPIRVVPVIIDRITVEVNLNTRDLFGLVFLFIDE